MSSASRRDWEGSMFQIDPIAQFDIDFEAFIDSSRVQDDQPSRAVSQQTAAVGQAQQDGLADCASFDMIIHDRPEDLEYFDAQHPRETGVESSLAAKDAHLSISRTAEFASQAARDTLGSLIKPAAATTLTKGGKPRFSQRARKLLQQWFNAHLTRPYPSEQEKSALIQSTGLSHHQIKTWFVNARTRFKGTVRRLSEDLDTQPKFHAVSAHPAFGPDHSVHRKASESSMSRYLSNPDEAASMEDIQHAATLTPILTIDHSPDISQAASPNGSEFNSQCSSFSGTSGSSLSHEGTRRKGRSRFARSARSMHSACSSLNVSYTSPGNYFCTFCLRPYDDRAAWARHELTCPEAPRAEHWVCCPEGERFLQTCFFCGEEKEYCITHYESHKVEECSEKPEPERDFRRKDQLMQHIRRCHISKDEYDNPDLRAGLNKRLQRWLRRSSPEELGERGLWCGFCHSRMANWYDRRRHLVGHFRDGVQISHWTEPYGEDLAMEGMG